MLSDLKKAENGILKPQTLAAYEYYPFGMILQKIESSTGYRYKFNGKEMDDEGMGGGSSTYDYGFRIYNPALARFLSIDPLTREFPWNSPYAFAENDAIRCIDLDGKEKLIAIHSPWYQSEIQKAVKAGDIRRAQYLSIKACIDPAKNDYAKKVYHGNNTAGTFNKVMAAEGGLHVYGYDDKGAPILLFKFPEKPEPKPVEEEETFNMFFGLLTYGSESKGDDNTTATHTMVFDEMIFELVELLMKDKQFERPEDIKEIAEEISERVEEIAEILEKEEPVTIPLERKTYPKPSDYTEPPHDGNSGGNYITPDSSLYEKRTYNKDGKQVSKDTIDTSTEKMK